MENKEKPSVISREEKEEITKMVEDLEKVLEEQHAITLVLESALVSAIGKKKQEKLTQVMQQTSEEILQLKRALENRVEETPHEYASSNNNESVGMAAEKAVGALCYLPKSIHRLATRYADDHDVTVKRFFLETMLIGLEQQGVITHEQHLEALTLPNEYGWKGRSSKKS